MLELAREQLTIEGETESNLEQAIVQFKNDLEKYRIKEIQLMQGQNEILTMIEHEERVHPENVDQLQKAKSYANNELKQNIETVHNKIEQYEQHIESLEKRLEQLRLTREITQTHTLQLEKHIHSFESNPLEQQDVDLEEGSLIMNEAPSIALQNTAPQPSAPIDSNQANNNS